MVMLTKIGNSQGIRIPKPIISQAKLENVPIELKVVKEGLLLKPVPNMPRAKWKDNIEKVLSKNCDKEDEGIVEDLLDDSDLEDFQW